MQSEAKVAKIISDTQIVINQGEANGIKEGTKYHIIDKKGEVVIDPENGSELGTLDILKAKVVVKTLYPNMAVCENADRYQSPLGFVARSGIMNPTNLTSSQPKPLNVDHEQITGGFNYNSDIPIQVGDRAILIR